MIYLFPGSYDPPTKGHLDIIERSAKIADKLIVAVLDNPNKNCMYTVSEREDMLRKMTAHLPNVEVDSFSGLLADYVKKKGVKAIVRGVRNVLDYVAETERAHANLALSGVETLFMSANPEYLNVSSTMIREILAFSGDVTRFVPESILKSIKK